MAYKLQLVDAQNDIGIQNVAGACKNTVEFIDLVNRVTRRLMKRGDWFDTEQVVKLCVYGCHAVMPRYVGAVRGARGCPDSAEVFNNWYSILGPSSRCSSRGCGSIGLSDAGTTPCFNEISGNTGKFIRYHVVKSQDLGKTITFYGKQYGAQPLQEKVAGAWQMGSTLTAQLPVAQTGVLVTAITSVVRQATQGMTYVYEYDPDTTTLRNLAFYEPNETNPRYRRYLIGNIGALPCHTDANGVTVRTMEAMVKLQYIPVANENDFLLIDDLDALALGIQAIKREQAGDDEGAEVKWLSAIREMNYGDRDKEGRISVRVNALGSRRVVTNMT